MKTKQFKSASLLILACIFSGAAFSQIVPGGGTECPKSYSVKRNNGNDKKVCNGDAEIRVTFLQLPTSHEVPSITSIEYEGQPLSNISLPASGTLVTTGKGYISYCVKATSKSRGDPLGKIPAGAKLVLELTSPNGVVCRTDNGN